MSHTTGARLSTTSEGLWLTAALAGVSRLPEALRIRPIGAVERVLPGHPGLQILQDQGICSGRTLDVDVDRWMWTLGRPDLQITVTIKRPPRQLDQLTGPPPVFDPKVDPLEEPILAYEALMAWNARFGPRRVAVLCCRDGQWVSAARVWQSHQAVDPDTPTADGADPLSSSGTAQDAEQLDEIDEVVITDLGGCDPAAVVNDIVGTQAARAQFDAINLRAGTLEQVLLRWQRDPSIDLSGELRAWGLSALQARIVQASADMSAAQITVSAKQFSRESIDHAAHVLTITDTLEGRVLKTDSESPDGQRWMTLLPGSPRWISEGVATMCASLPAGQDWLAHRRERQLGA